MPGACKTCNSRLKANFFPVAGRHSFTGTNPIQLNRRERPYLIYPLGDVDDDNAEDLIAFEGLHRCRGGSAFAGPISP